MNREKYLSFLFAAVAVVAISWNASGARSADARPTSTENGHRQLDTVTIEAARARRELQRQVEHYVTSEVVTYMHDSLARWNQPICPIVVGLPPAEGEYLFKRISDVATAAHARMATPHCGPNLYIVATSYPDLLVKKWREQDPRMYGVCDGIGPVSEFLHSRQPIRIFYNTNFRGSDGRLPNPVLLNLGALLGCTPIFTGGGMLGSRLTFSAVRGLQAVVIIVDMSQVKSITIGQLADYVSVAALAQIQPDADPGPAPTILTLFRDQKHAPKSLTPWDQALLYALYNTDQSSMLEVSLIERRMVSRIGRVR